MSNLPQKLQEIKERCENATPGPWEYAGNVGIDYECLDCGAEFPEQGYAVKSKDEHQVLECHLYGMKRFCVPDGEFIAHSRQDIPLLVKALEKAIEQRDEGNRLLQDLEWIVSAENISNEENQELEAILEGEC